MSKVQVFSYTDDVSHTCNEALRHLADMSCEFGLSDNASSVYDALLAREAQGSTAMVQGISLPHAKSPDILASAVVVVRFAHPIAWKVLKDTTSQVQVALFLLMPEGQEGLKHLKNLSKIAAFLSHEDNTEFLLHETDLKKVSSAIQTALED